MATTVATGHTETVTVMKPHQGTPSPLQKELLETNKLTRQSSTFNVDSIFYLRSTMQTPHLWIKIAENWKWKAITKKKYRHCKYSCNKLAGSNTNKHH
jgi:hypothetical protein